MPNRNNEIPAANPASATSRRRQTVTVPHAPAPLAGTQPLTEAGRQRMVAASRSRLLAGTGAKVFWAVLAVAVVAGSIGFALLLHANPVASAGLAVATLVGYAIFLWWILSPIIVRVGMWSMARAGWLVGYFDETATQLVHPRSGGWELSDHHAVVQGAGIAAPFRRRVFTHLAAEADRHQVPITMSSRIPKLVAIYQADMPGLRVIGTARTLFGTLYLLRRDPAAPPLADPVNGDGSATTTPTNDQLECLDGAAEEPDCSGPVTYRHPLSGTGRSFPRCEKHWERRLRRQDEINRRYPVTPPRDWSPLDAGEAWDENDY